MQDQHQSLRREARRRSAAPRIAAPQVETVKTLDPPSRPLQHRRRSSTAITRPTDGASAALICPRRTRVADDQSHCAGRQRGEMKAMAEQLVAQRSHWPADDRRIPPISTAGAPAPPRDDADLRRRARHPPVREPTARAAAPRGPDRASSYRGGSCLAPATRPNRVGKRLQVAADRGLRQLNHPAELGHGQLVPIEHQQHAASDVAQEPM